MGITAASPLPTAGAATMRGAYFGQIAWDYERNVAVMDHPKFIEGLAYWVDLKLKHRVVPTAEEADGSGRGQYRSARHLGNRQSRHEHHQRLPASAV